MNMTYLKSRSAERERPREELSRRVAELLARCETGGEAAACELARRFDGWEGPIEVSPAAIDEACARVPQALKDDIAYAHENIRRFAEAQRDSLCEFEIELRPGLFAGQHLLPIRAAGCYVPGGRYAHIASAMMTVTTARVAGVPHVAAVTPPRAGAPAGVPDAILYTLRLCGADRVLALGGVQGIAALAYGLFGLVPADILVGPGNAFVTEAKRLLFGEVGIDLTAGPTDTLIIGDAEANPEWVAWDLLGQAEHGANSPVRLVTDDPALAARIPDLIPRLTASLPEPNRQAARAAWESLGEVILCRDREEMALVADRIGPEHLHVQARDLAWWKGRLRSYGALFLGPETTVAFGDKASGPNHVLPTAGAARYSGGLSVQKFLRAVTWQRVGTPALERLAEVTATISRVEGMEAHARTAELRLAGLAAGREAQARGRAGPAAAARPGPP